MNVNYWKVVFIGAELVCDDRTYKAERGGGFRPRDSLHPLSLSPRSKRNKQYVSNPRRYFEFEFK